MNKRLKFEIRQNLRNPARAYVKSTQSNTIYGSFQVNNPDEFEGWDKLSSEETIELQQFFKNIKAVNKYLKEGSANQLTDFRFRLPIEFIEMIDKLSVICSHEQLDFDIFDSMMTAIIHQMRIVTAKLSSASKMDALALLEEAGLADFKKQTHNEQIQAVFTEIQALFNRSEKLHHKARTLFNKDKSYSPMAIKGMATGETLPAKWLVACAIDLLIDEIPQRIRSLLSANDFYILWAKPLKDSTYSVDVLLKRAAVLASDELVRKITEQ